MFSRWERLPRAAFSSLRSAKRRTNEHMTALLPAEGAGYAVVISKKTLPKAVDRHALKRKVLGALRQTPGLTLPPALILYPKASLTALSPAGLRASLKNLLEN